MIVQTISDASTPIVHPGGPVADTFSDDRPAGTVLGTSGEGGAVRLGCDVERQIAIDNGALRFQPLVRPGWGRQGIAYGPFRRESGLVLAVSITNGHNTSQASSIPENIAKRIYRWAVGPNADPLVNRLVAWARGPRKMQASRRFLWWMRSTSRTYKLPNIDENLAVGWFTSDAPKNPLIDGCGFIVHAAEGENGELWTRVGNRCLSAFRRLKNLQVYYVVALRERGAVYYAAAIVGANGLAGFPMLRPIAIDPFNDDETLFAGVHQCVLGQIGFRVDTRVHGVHIEHMPDFASPFGTAHAGDSLTGDGELAATAAVRGGAWKGFRGRVNRTETGANAGEDGAVAILDPGAPSGLIHCLVETRDIAAATGLIWRVRDVRNFWLLKVSGEGCFLILVENGIEKPVAKDKSHRLNLGQTQSVQILDANGQVGCYLDGERLFDTWFDNNSLEDETGVGLWFGEIDGARVRDFEAHPREVPMPSTIDFEAPWSRSGTRVQIFDDFRGSQGELAGRPPAQSVGTWEKTLGIGNIDVDGSGGARVRATRESPHPARTFHTLPWPRPKFADLEVTITPPGDHRGQKHRCRSGLVFWQDKDNYLSFTAYVDDSYKGSSIALFTKRHGFEELYDAVWTMLWDLVDWGKPFRLRIAFDGNRFIIFIDDEPVLQRALTDLYPDDPPMTIMRVGLAVNWEWGDDTGSVFEAFTARS